MQKHSWLPFLCASSLLLPAHTPHSPPLNCHNLAASGSFFSPCLFVTVVFYNSVFRLFFPYLSSFPFLTHLLGPLKPSPPHLIVAHTSLHQLAPYRMEPLASVLPVVRLDWIQLGRLFALQSLLVGSVDDRFACRRSLLLLLSPHSNTHTHKHTLLHPFSLFPFHLTQCSHPSFLLFHTIYSRWCIFFLCVRCLHCVSSPCWCFYMFFFATIFNRLKA